MIEHLKQLYPHDIMTDPSKVSSHDDYIWFQTEKGPIGLLKSAISAKEQALLEMFLTSYVTGQNLTREQSFWHDLLFTGRTPSQAQDREIDSFRFIHLFVKDPAIDKVSFAEAVDGLFPSETVLWETEQEGVLIEPLESDREDTIGYEDLVDAVTSDFYTDLFLYVGGKQSQLEEAPERFRQEKTYFHSCRSQIPKQSVFYHGEQIPFLLLQHTSETTKKALFNELFQEVADDRELLDSIHQYLACNMNVTTAAKKLFIHRNSLQYRVDKFVEKTGLDVKSFPEAVTVYLALLDQYSLHSSGS